MGITAQATETAEQTGARKGFSAGMDVIKGAKTAAGATDVIASCFREFPWEPPAPSNDRKVKLLRKSEEEQKQSLRHEDIREEARAPESIDDYLPVSEAGQTPRRRAEDVSAQPPGGGIIGREEEDDDFPEEIGLVENPANMSGAPVRSAQNVRERFKASRGSDILTEEEEDGAYLEEAAETEEKERAYTAAGDEFSGNEGAELADIAGGEKKGLFSKLFSSGKKNKAANKDAGVKKAPKKAKAPKAAKKAKPARGKKNAKTEGAPESGVSGGTEKEMFTASGADDAVARELAALTAKVEMLEEGINTLLQAVHAGDAARPQNGARRSVSK